MSKTVWMLHVPYEGLHDPAFTTREACEEHWDWEDYQSDWMTIVEVKVIGDEEVMNEEQREWFLNWRMVIRDYTFDSDREYVSDGELIDLLLWKLDEWGVDPPHGRYSHSEFNIPEHVTEKTRQWVKVNIDAMGEAELKKKKESEQE